MRPLTQLLNSNDSENLDFAYQYLHVNSEPTLYPPEDTVKNLIRMSAYMDKKLGAISANRVMDFRFSTSSAPNVTSGRRSR